MAESRLQTIRRFVLGGTLCCLAATGAAYCTRAVILQKVGNTLVRSDPLMPADAIVVLAGGNGERELEGAAVYQAGLAPRVLLTAEREPAVTPVLRQRGVHIETGPERRRRFMVELGVPDGAIVTLQDHVVLSTADEAEQVANWAASQSAHSVLVVTSSYHTGRAGRIFRRALGPLGLTVRVRAASYSGFRAVDWWQDRESLKIGLWEVEKTLAFSLTRW